VFIARAIPLKHSAFLDEVFAENDNCDPDLSDLFAALASSDALCGTNKNDTCRAGPGNDLCVLKGGNVCDLGPGNDTCVTLGGNDVCIGGPGNDACDLGGGSNLCVGPSPEDVCNGRRAKTASPPPPPSGGLFSYRLAGRLHLDYKSPPLRSVRPLPRRPLRDRVRQEPEDALAPARERRRPH
jgi:hypothetical protein